MAIKPPPGYELDEDITPPDGYVLDQEPTYLEKTISNIPADIKQFVTGLGGTIKEGAYDMPKRALETGLEMASGTPYANTPSGQKDVELIENAPEQAKEMVRPIIHPVDYFQEHPVQQTINLASAILPFAGKPISGKLGQIAGNESLKNLGASMKQVRDLGIDKAQDVGRWAIDKRITTANPFVGDMTMSKRIEALEGAAGEAVGKGRKIGDARGGSPTIEQLKNATKESLVPEYEKGVKSGEFGGLKKAIDEIEKIENPNFTNIAKKSTEINQYAKGQHQINQQSGAATDVANLLSRENNTALQKVLKPQEFKAYKTALKDYGNIKKVGEFFLRRESRDAAGRSGIGGMIASGFRAAGDLVGHRTAADVTNLMAKMAGSPAFAKALPILTTAANNGPEALETADFVLRNMDPDYAEAIK